ncbi:MAG: monovalent cation/H+ antiporter subunit D family protein [Granulosicoccaceae bacterium]
MNQWPVIQILLPMIAAPLCALISRGRSAWLLASLITWASLFVAIVINVQVLDQHTLSYQLGGWAPPWGIELRIDSLNSMVLLLITGLATVIITAARDSINKEVSEEKIPLYYTAYLLSLAAMIGITITGDAFNVFVFLEISSLSTYALIAMGRDRRALVATYRYLIMGTIGATFILIGIGLMYQLTGTLNMADLATKIPAMFDNRVAQVAFAFFILGVSIKIALYPLHYWLPNAYTYAPSVASAYLAGTATKVSMYVLLRFLFGVFGVQFSFEELQVQHVLMPMSVVGIMVGSMAAIYQDDIKKVLAYSSVAQLSYMVLGIAIASETSLTASVVHIFNHGLVKSALFLCVACMVYSVGSSKLEDLSGAAKRMPWTVAAFAVAGVALIGVPLTAGFITKWYLILAVIEHGWWPLAIVLVVSSLMAVAYVGRVVDYLWFKPMSEKVAAHGAKPPRTILIPAAVLSFACIYFGIDTGVTLGAADRVVQALLGGTP